MERFTNSWGAIFRFTLLSLVCGVSVKGFAQNSPKSYIECNHDSLITVLRAYEDSLAISSSTTVVRADYALRVTDGAVEDKVYKIYRCDALYDSLEVLLEALRDRVAFTRMTPPTVDTDSIGSISGTGATFYGKVTSDGDTAVTAQWFKYGLSAGSLSDSLAVSGVVTPFSAVASGLANGTTYYVAAFAKNVKGTSPGDTLSFTTHAAPTVATGAATSVTSSAATLNATITATGGAVVTATGFKYGTDAGLTTPSDVAGGGNSSPFTGSLTGLTASTQYWAVGYATNSVGTSYGDTTTFTTNAVAPTVATGAATSVTSSAATLNATITATGGAAVSATGFKYATNSALTTPTDIAGSGTSSPFTGSLTGLSPGTHYWAVGYATNSVGTSYGDTITFTTSAFTCGTSTVTYDGHAYTTVQIGTQCWFKENLRNDNYRDGTAIPGNLTASAWANATSGAQADYLQYGAYLADYGRLYNWYAVANPAGLCPSGWHVPTDTDWTALETQLGGSPVAGAEMKVSWSNSPSWDGTNSSGFSALPGGSRTHDNGAFDNLRSHGFWWSSSPDGLSGGWYRILVSENSSVIRYNWNARAGFSVRCLQDAAPTVDTDAASSVTSSAATLNATITATGGAAVSATGFKYATNSALTTPTDIAGSGTSSPFTGSLTSLSPGTQYWAVGYATNSVGTSYGDTITFTTSFTCGTSTVTYDGHAYTTVLIGTQCWFKENMRNDNYNDGTAIPGNLNNSTWTSTTSGAQTVYDQGGSNVASNLTTYGRLYNWYAVTNAAGLCPTGWHVPTDAEWTALETHLGGASGAGAAMKASSSDSPAWNGTNSSGFSALPGGYRTYDNGNFANLGDYGDWWSSSPSGSHAWNRNLFSGSSGVTRYHNYVRYGFSVRCLQDAAPTVDTDAASSVTETTATLNATITVTGGAAVSATGFKYATNSALTTPTDVPGSGTSSPFTGSLTGLTPSTQYWAVSYATNSVGTSYGDTITFTTRAPFTCGTSTLTYDGHAYTTVLIGSQCWFKENLRNDNYNDGTAILGNLNNSTWTSTTSGAQTVYEQGGANEASNLTTYGRLYNWYAVTNAAGLCPTGWHVPTDAEWTALETQLGGASGAGAAMKASSSDSPAWNGTNSSGFSALPGGYRTYDNGNFANLGSYGDWWSSSPSGSDAWNRNLFSGSSGVTRYHNYVRYGFSVRCVRD